MEEPSGEESRPFQGAKDYQIPTQRVSVGCGGDESKEVSKGQITQGLVRDSKVFRFCSGYK